MITIRSQQLAEFERQFVVDFETRAIGQMREGYPDRTEGVSEAQLRARVQSAVSRSKQYGLESEIAVLYFLNAAILLGDDRFDVNPNYPEASEILGNSFFSEDEKAEALFEYAFDIDEARGMNNHGR